MTVTINDDSMSGDHTGHTARPASGYQHAWEVSWLPGRLLDRNEAITAMVLADLAASDTLHDRHRLWPHAEGWAAELGLTAPDALARMSQPAGDATAGKQDPEPEAAG
jgi:hypothetical protein